MLAANKVAKNSMAALIICVVQFVLLFILFKAGFGPVWARYVGIIGVFVFGFFIKPYVLCKDIGYRWQDMLHYLWRGVRAIIAVGGLNLALFFLIPQNTIWQSGIVLVLSVLTVLVCALLLMEASLRAKIWAFLKKKVSRR